MIGAADAALLDAAEPQRDAAVRAELVDQPVAALAVTECDQPFRQDLDAHRRAIVFRQLLCEQGRNPVLTEEIASGCPRARLCQELVDLRLQHG